MRSQEAASTGNRTPARPIDGQHGVTRAGMVGGLVLLAVIGFVVFQSLGTAQATCEVCMQYRGRSQCRAVSGASIAEAKRAAIVNACAYISSGVTDSMACQRADPISEKCW